MFMFRDPVNFVWTSRSALLYFVLNQTEYVWFLLRFYLLLSSRIYKGQLTLMLALDCIDTSTTITDSSVLNWTFVQNLLRLIPELKTLQVQIKQKHYCWYLEGECLCLINTSFFWKWLLTLCALQLKVLSSLE